MSLLKDFKVFALTSAFSVYGSKCEWEFDKDDYYKIINRSTGQVLDVFKGLNVYNIGTWNDSGNDNQQWKITKIANDPYNADIINTKNALESKKSQLLDSQNQLKDFREKVNSTTRSEARNPYSTKTKSIKRG